MIRAGRGYIKHAWYGLSIPTLARTLFAPWKRDYDDASDQSLAGKMRVGFENLISRFVGLLIRVFTIFAGLAIVAFEAIFYAGAFCLWLGLPFVVVILLALAVGQIGAR